MLRPLHTQLPSPAIAKLKILLGCIFYLRRGPFYTKMISSTCVHLHLRVPVFARNGSRSGSLVRHAHTCNTRSLLVLLLVQPDSEPNSSSLPWSDNRPRPHSLPRLPAAGSLCKNTDLEGGRNDWTGEYVVALFRANRGPRPSADGLVSVDGLAFPTKTKTSRAIKYLNIYPTNN